MSRYQAPRAWWVYAVKSTVVELRAALAAAKHQRWLETFVLDRYLALYIRSLASAAAIDLPMLTKVCEPRAVECLPASTRA